MASSPSFTQKSNEPEETELEKILKMRKAKCSDNNNVVSWNSRKQQLTQQRSFELPPRLSYTQGLGPGTTKADLLRKSTSFRHQAPPRQHQHHLQLLKPDVPIKPVTSQKMFMVSSKIPSPSKLPVRSFQAPPSWPRYQGEFEVTLLISRDLAATLTYLIGFINISSDSDS